MQEVKESLEFAREVGATAVVVHAAPGLLAMPEEMVPGNPNAPDARGLAEQEELTIRALKDLADFAPDLLICLENLVFPTRSTAAPGAAGAGAQGEPFQCGHHFGCGACRDRGAQSLDYVHLLFDELFHVHLHDNHGKPMNTCPGPGCH